MSKRHDIIEILSVDSEFGIGKKNGLLFHLPKDMAFFRATTLNHVVAMGENTLLSFPGSKPLKSRTNIVLSQDKTHNYKNVLNVHTLDQFFRLIDSILQKEDVFIIGGASIYRQLLPYSNKVLLTKVHANGGAEVFFPNIDENPNFRCISKQPPIMDEGSIEIEFTTYANDGAAPLRYEKSRGKTVEMNLCDGPFQAIKEGFKDIEMRLFDEKRADLEVGDVIIFTNLATGEKLSRTVIALAPFDSFETLYAAFPKSRLGYRDDEDASPKDMEQYYPAEKIAKYGPLAIFLE